MQNEGNIQLNSDSEEKPDNEFEGNPGSQVPFYLGKNGVISWSNVPVGKKTNTSDCNIVTKLPTAE